MIIVMQRVEISCDSERSSSRDQIVEQARNRLAKNRTYEHYFQHVTCYYEEGVLTLRGRVPTDRLMHTLACLLSDLVDIDSINNQVDVISSTGLSFIRPK